MNRRRKKGGEGGGEEGMRLINGYTFVYWDKDVKIEHRQKEDDFTPFRLHKLHI